MSPILIAVGVVIATIFVVILGTALIFKALFRKVEQGKVLVVSTRKEVVASFTGRIVVPVIHKAETMDISVKTINIDRRRHDGLICMDNIRADISVNFFVKVNSNSEDVIRVAQTIGCARASDHTTLRELFEAKFSEALKTAGRQFDFIDLYTKRREFRDAIMEIIGQDLDGYVLSDVAIDYLEQTKIEDLDPDNILDAEGIKKITQLTAEEHVVTNEYRNEERKRIRAKDVETEQAVLELDRQEADARARQEREIATVVAREAAAAATVEEEERLKAEAARITTDQEIGIQEENREREVAVARMNRERVIQVETENIEKARRVAAMQVEVEATAAEKDLEREKSDIATLQRERIAVEKTVAEQEEAIKSLRLVEDANRHREAAVIQAEADAQAEFVGTIKAAEAREQAASHDAKQRVTLAEADLHASDLEAQAKVKLAEGVKAEVAAPGLAEVQVESAKADAIERVGLAEIKVKEADAVAIEKVGTAQAAVVREQGAAEGTATAAKLKGEAEGIEVKAGAVAKMNEAGAQHEEFRLRLDADTRVRLAQVDAEVGIAKAGAEAVGTALSNADIDIVGGDTVFVDKVLSAVTHGKRFDAAVENTDTGRALLSPYLEGDGNVVRDVTRLLGGIGTEGIEDLTVSAFLTTLMQKGDGNATKLSKVIEALQAEGLGDLKVSDLLNR